MFRNKKIIEESFDKMKDLISDRFNKTASDIKLENQGGQQKTQQMSSAMDAEMNNAMKLAVGNIGNILKGIADSSGDKDGQLDAQGQEAQGTDKQQNSVQSQSQTQSQVSENAVSSYLNVNEEMLNKEVQQEAVGMLAGGLALSAPTIISWVGKGVGAIGKKADSKTMNWVGKKMEKFGEKWHHAYINTIAKAVASLMAPDENGNKMTYDNPKVQKVANIVFMSIVAVMGAGAASGATAAAASGQSALATVEGGLAGVKGIESSSSLLRGMLPILKSLGIG